MYMLVDETSLICHLSLVILSKLFNSEVIPGFGFKSSSALVSIELNEVARGFF